MILHILWCTKDSLSKVMVSTQKKTAYKSFLPDSACSLEQQGSLKNNESQQNSCGKLHFK
jgi:hypothetical protein